MEPRAPASLLTIPCELRNVIYLHIFSPESTYELPTYNERKDPFAAVLKPQFDDNSSRAEQGSPRHLRVLQTCKQIHKEAYLLAISLTTFHVVGPAAHPSRFAAQLQMRNAKVAAIRHLTLTAKIAELRALNETWGGYAFGNPSLNLETLIIIPKKTETSYSSYRVVADFSQGNTLAHVLSETLKCLRNVRCVIVKNQGCFADKVWQPVYRSIVWTLWRWGGYKNGMRFQCCDAAEEGSGEEWFKVWLMEGDEGSECGDEVIKLVEKNRDTLPDPSLFNI